MKKMTFYRIGEIIIEEQNFNVVPIIYCYENTSVDQWAKTVTQEIIYLDENMLIVLPDYLELYVGETGRLEADIGIEVNEDTLWWSTTDSEIVTVGQAGEVKGIAVGTAFIILTAEDGLSSSCQVIVREMTCLSLPQALVVLECEALMGIATECCVLPNGLERIESRAFANSYNLVRIEIPSSVTSIADDAFEGCCELTIVTPEGSTAYDFAIAHGINWSCK